MGAVRCKAKNFPELSGTSISSAIPVSIFFLMSSGPFSFAGATTASVGASAVGAAAFAGNKLLLSTAIEEVDPAGSETIKR